MAVFGYQISISLDFSNIQYQTLDAAFNHFSKHLKVHRKYCCALYFKLISRNLEMWQNMVCCVHNVCLIKCILYTRVKGQPFTLVYKIHGLLRLTYYINLEVPAKV